MDGLPSGARWFVSIYIDTARRKIFNFSAVLPMVNRPKMTIFGHFWVDFHHRLYVDGKSAKNGRFSKIDRPRFWPVIGVRKANPGQNWIGDFGLKIDKMAILVLG